MADEQTPEAVALVLLQRVAFLENKQIVGTGNGPKPDRAWLLDTYAECLQATKGNRTMPTP